jgi:hypothetical protein
MAKIKEITKAQPQPIKDVWWFKVTLDTGEEAYYSNTMEEPYKVGDDIPYYNFTEEKGRGGTKKILHVLPPPPIPEEPKKIEVTAEFGEKRSVVLAAKARACIDAMGYAVTFTSGVTDKKVNDVYPALLKAIHKELDRI